jgi:predicted ATPase
VTFLVRDNGSGKSTLLEGMAAGVDAVAAGARLQISFLATFAVIGRAVSKPACERRSEPARRHASAGDFADRR